MQQSFEYYIDDIHANSENSILYGKAIMVAMSKDHKQSWTKKQKDFINKVIDVYNLSDDEIQEVKHD